MEELLFEQKGHLGLITLNRVKALNALTLPMLKALQQQLDLWKKNEAIHAVVIQSSADNAFCAGGDVRWLYQAGLEKNPQQMEFFLHEYRLNNFINQLGKPYIALLDGITMGGGVGISLHGSHPVASEAFVFAMPESSIGFFPDIGASYLLTRCPGYLGVYLGLTGAKLGPWESYNAGLVKKVLSREDLRNLFLELQSVDLSKNAYAEVDKLLASYRSPAAESQIENKLELINNCFNQPTIELIRSALLNRQEEWAEKTAVILDQKAPLSLKVILQQWHKAQGLTLADCLKMDLILVNHFMKSPDFYEGVRALLIDKDKKPIWNPSSLEAVSEEMVIQYFERDSFDLTLK